MDNYYKELLKKHYESINEKDIQEYMDFCLDYVKENIINCYSNEKSTKNVIEELFKRGMAKKWKLKHD